MSKCLQVYLAVLIVLISCAFYSSVQEPVSTVVNYSAKQIEVKTGGKLLNQDGSLIHTGFARSPLKDLNEEDIKPFLGLKQLSFLRYKKWDFFDIITDKFQILVHFADLGYAGNIQISLYVYESDKLITISDNIHDLSKLPKLSVNSMRYESDYKYQSDSLKISLKQTPNAEKDIHHVLIDLETSQFSVRARLVKREKDDELVMLTPISEDATNFYYNTKSYGLAAEGKLNVNDLGKSFIFNGTNALGGRDIGRGIWNYNSFWFWAHGQGYITDEQGNSVPFGIDLGNGFEHSSTNTYEDCIILNGRLHKLNTVQRTLDEDDVEKIWTIKTVEQGIPGSLNATFDPAVRATKDENFVVIQAKFKQFFGLYKGTFVDENGKTIAFENIYGFAELHRAKW